MKSDWNIVYQGFQQNFRISKILVKEPGMVTLHHRGVANLWYKSTGYAWPQTKTLAYVSFSNVNFW